MSVQDAEGAGPSPAARELALKLEGYDIPLNKFRLYYHVGDAKYRWAKKNPLGFFAWYDGYSYADFTTKEKAYAWLHNKLQEEQKNKWQQVR